ncbi:MAG: hypothetical protein HY399_08505 [Elusimicrobia bacterium]|nr:hypothetical protein [Elusimicrobiota bacterium]
MKVSKKYDLDLELMARQAMKLSFNKAGSDKSFVLDALYWHNDFWAHVNRIRAH